MAYTIVLKNILNRATLRFENIQRYERYNDKNDIREHQAQLFNYLAVTRLPIGLLVNFKRRKLEWKRLQSNEEITKEDLDWIIEEDEV